MVWAYALGSVALVSAIPLIGLAVMRRPPDQIARIVLLLLSFAVGALLGGALFHLIPEAVSRLGSGPALSLYLLLGFLGFFVLEKFLWAHRHDTAGTPSLRLQPLAALNLLGDGVHNAIDGMVIAAAYSADTSVGLATTLAVILHEVPQELGDFGILVYSGLPVRRAVLFNAASGLTAVLGAVVTLAVGEQLAGFTSALLPVAAGSFIYIAASDLIPELRRERGLRTAVWQVVLVLLGVVVMGLPELVH